MCLSSRVQQQHLKYGHPGQANVVKGDAAMEGVVDAGSARRVILVPVDASPIVNSMVTLF